MNETRCKTGQRQWTNAGARGISSYLVQVLMAKDCVGILQGPPGSHAAFPCCCSRINMSHMFIRLHAGLLLWVLLKPIPDLFALKIRNQFIPSLNSINGFFTAPQLLAWSFRKVFSCFLPFHMSFSSNYIPFSPCSGSLNKTNFW